jgi:hypothetical protein
MRGGPAPSRQSGLPTKSTMAAAAAAAAAAAPLPLPPPAATTTRWRQRRVPRTTAAASPSSHPPPALRTPRPIPTAPLGQSGIVVPRICLGTMLFGGDGGSAGGGGTTGSGRGVGGITTPTTSTGGTDYATASRLMSACAEAGASFFDSGEMYPVPPSEATWGRSEEMLGRWANAYGR